MDEIETKAFVAAAGDELTDGTRAAVRASIAGALRGVPPTPVAQVVGLPSKRPHQRLLIAAGTIATAAAVVVVAIAVQSDNHRVLSPTTEEPQTTQEPTPSTTAPGTTVLATPVTTVATSPSTTAVSITVPATTATTATTTVSTATTATTTGPTTIVATPIELPPPTAGGLGPQSVDFVTHDDGWVLPGSDNADGTTKATLLHTSDGGRTWATVHLDVPAGHTGTVRFADPLNGWLLIDETTVLATHDGGVTWHAVMSGAGNLAPMALAASATAVHVMALDSTDPQAQPAFRLFSAPATTDVFTDSHVQLPVGAGPVFEGHFALNGSEGWVIYVDRTLIGAATLRNGQWVTWTAPCGTLPNFVSGPDQVSAGPQAGRLVMACSSSQFSSPPFGTHVFVSDDGGTTAKETSLLPNNAQAITFVWQPSPHAIVIGYTLADGTGAIVRSEDDGATWTKVFDVPSNDTADPTLTYPIGTSGYVAGGVATYDEGRTWQPIAAGVVT